MFQDQRKVQKLAHLLSLESLYKDPFGEKLITVAHLGAQVGSRHLGTAACIKNESETQSVAGGSWLLALGASGGRITAY